MINVRRVEWITMEVRILSRWTTPSLPIGFGSNEKEFERACRRQWKQRYLILVSPIVNNKGRTVQDWTSSRDFCRGVKAASFGKKKKLGTRTKVLKGDKLRPLDERISFSRGRILSTMRIRLRLDQNGDSREIIFADKMLVTRMEENNETNLVFLSWKLGLEVGTAFNYCNMIFYELCSIEYIYT